MCGELCVQITFGIGTITLFMILFRSYDLITTVHDRSMFLENQFQLYDSWTERSLRQTHKFYFFNITNYDQFLWFDAPMTVDEIGPYVYHSLDSDQTVSPAVGHNVSSLSVGDLRFNLSESAGDESVMLYTLNVALIRRLASKPHSVSKMLDEGLVRQATVRDILREIVDGRDFSVSSAESFPKYDVSKEHRQDASWNYLQYLRNEICMRLFRVIQFLNPPTTAKSGRFFQTLPCDCLVIAPNGTESMGREDPKYNEVRTSKYILLWDDEKCAESSSDPSVPIQRYRYVTEHLFSLSSPAYWRNDGYVQYKQQAENSSELRIKVEPLSDVITDFSFEYQLNIPIKFRDEKFPRERVNSYPILRVVTSGVSVEDMDSSIYRYLVYPTKCTIKFRNNVVACILWYMASFFGSVWAYYRIRRTNNGQRTIQV